MNLSQHNTGLKLAAAVTQHAQNMPSGFRPWDDTTLSPEQRFDAYKAHVRQQVESMIAAASKLSPIESQEFERSPATQTLLAHAEELATMTAEEYAQRLASPREIRDVLGSRLLGPEEWKAAFGVDVGPVPLIPSSITKELLESPCPFTAEKCIKDTHLLVFVPKAIDGAPYTALKLYELCVTVNPTGYKLINDDDFGCTNLWKNQPWASKPVDSGTWVLMLQDQPVFGKRDGTEPLRGKGIRAQVRTLESHYPEYEQVNALSRMTAFLLYEIVREERLYTLPSRCLEPNSTGEGRTLMLHGLSNNLWIVDTDGGNPSSTVGLAVGRRV